MDNKAIPGTRRPEFLAAVALKHEPLDERLNPVAHPPVEHEVLEVQVLQLAPQAEQLELLTGKYIGEH